MPSTAEAVLGFISDGSRFFTTVLAYLAVLQLYAENFSITASLPPLALRRMRLLFRFKPSILILSLANLYYELGLMFDVFFFAIISRNFLFSMSMASRSGMKKRNHCSVCWSSPQLVKAYCQFGIPRCMTMTRK